MYYLEGLDRQNSYAIMQKTWSVDVYRVRLNATKLLADYVLEDPEIVLSIHQPF